MDDKRRVYCFILFTSAGLGKRSFISLMSFFDVKLLLKLSKINLSINWCDYFCLLENYISLHCCLLHVLTNLIVSTTHKMFFLL